LQPKIERLQMPLIPKERQPVSEASTNVDVKALKDKRKKFLVFQ
jgi:hypothetical protein